MTNTLYVVIDASGAASGARSATNSVNSITQSVINLNMHINQINGHTNNMSKSAISNFNKMGGAIDKLGNGLRMLLGIFAAVQGVRLFESFIREIQDVDRVYNGFIAMMNVTTGDVAKSKLEYQYVAATAKAYGVSLQSLLHTYAKLSAATKEILSINQTKKVFEAMTAVSTVLHAKATTIDRMFNAVIQIASKGQLMMEELKQQLGEHLPGALALAATAMNMTMGELMDAMKKGQIGAKEFLSKFPDTLMEKFGAAAEVASKSLHATYSRLKSSVFMMFQEMSSNGIALGMSAVLIAINQHIDSGSDSFKRFGQVVGEAFVDLAKFIDQITPQ
ncbi:MAG: tape measure protein, partial [Saprospiraceae bacterium]